MAGQRIDDHSSWVGKGNKGSVFPEGVKVKDMSSAEGAGGLSSYEDTSNEIQRAQEMGDKKVKSHSMKANYRN